MKKYGYLKSNAFTVGESLGNPAACVFTGKDALSPQQMQAIAKEHKGAGKIQRRRQEGKPEGSV